MTELDTYRQALDAALYDLEKLLAEARAYVWNEEYKLAVIGTLHAFDNCADDVKAALRLYTNATRRDK